MNTTEFIKDRNAQIKAEYKESRSDKTKNREERIAALAEKHNVSTSIVHDAIYRTKVIVSTTASTTHA